MRMNKNQKRSSGSGSSDFENKLEFVNDSFEMMETDRVHGVSGGATTASVSTTSSEDTVQSVSSGGNRMSSSDLSQLLSDGIPVGEWKWNSIVILCCDFFLAIMSINHFCIYSWSLA